MSTDGTWPLTSCDVHKHHVYISGPISLISWGCPKTSLVYDPSSARIPTEVHVHVYNIGLVQVIRCLIVPSSPWTCKDMLSYLEYIVHDPSSTRMSLDGHPEAHVYTLYLYSTRSELALHAHSLCVLRYFKCYAEYCTFHFDLCVNFHVVNLYNIILPVL